MAKTKKDNTAKKSFEERLERLEELGDEIRNNEISLDDAIKAFEEGIVLARALEKDLEKIESRVEILMNADQLPADDDEGDDAAAAARPEFGLFDDD
ncbi:MAG: exodeoxyribonuclease VII small subunit [Treponema sp.]|nr:exodeoxyribonuclease VII small subunit [Treponema sp.]